MKISCPTCSAKYSIADEKVHNRLAKIRCRKCGTSIVIDGNVSPANVYAAEGTVAGDAPVAHTATGATNTAASAAKPGVVYTVDLGENDQRQMTTAQLVEAYNSASVSPETYVWADGFADWMPLAQVNEIVAALHAAAAVATEMTASPIDEASAVGASTHIDEKPWDSGPSDVMRSTAVAPISGGGADLFGSVSDAGAESDNVSVGTAANPFSGANTGARNESSVLFSLSALTSGTGSSRPSVPAPASSTGGNNDDSGLIDLRAITATAAAMAQSAQAIPAMPAPPVVNPFAAASPLGGPSPMAGGYGTGNFGSIPAPKSNNNGLYIGAGIVIAAIAVAAIVTFGGSEVQPVAPPVPAVTAAAPIAAPAPPAPAPAPEPAATSDAKPPATGTGEEEAAPSGTQKKSVSKPRVTASPSASPKPSASPSPSPAPKPKASGRCGCKADDLMCLMNCAK